MFVRFIFQLAFPDAVYLVDAIEGGKELIQACKAALESDHITKVIHDCKRDSEVPNCESVIFFWCVKFFVEKVVLLNDWLRLIILQALYFQFGIKLHNVMDTQVITYSPYVFTLI